MRYTIVCIYHRPQGNITNLFTVLLTTDYNEDFSQFGNKISNFVHEKVSHKLLNQEQLILSLHLIT